MAPGRASAQLAARAQSTALQYGPIVELDVPVKEGKTMVIDESALLTIPGTTPEDRESSARQKPFADKTFQTAGCHRSPAQRQAASYPTNRRLHHG
ncbi:hypothetical protein C1S80_06395 [Mycolicibacterium aubagnense]|nr:hypothetical protein C1S80_06395 [Mycolicibacterium aubagnense]